MEKIQWISPLPLCNKSQTFSCTCTKIWTGARQSLMVTGQPLLTPSGQWGSTFLKALTLTGYFLVFTGIARKVPGMFQSGTFLLFLMSSQKHPLSLWKTQTSNIFHAFLLALASSKHRSEIHAWVAKKVSHLGKWEKVALFPSSDFTAKKPTSKRRFSKCVSGDYPWSDYHCG